MLTPLTEIMNIHFRAEHGTPRLHLQKLAV
jgi:hypothetical protein